jgi:CubicO group peptidase (beta-lactamase class C family)
VAIRWNRIETWLMLGVAGIGAILLGVAGLFVYMSATAKPLHPDPNAIESVAGENPSPQWTKAVEEARRAARAHLADRNLPGLSIAVGVNGEIVWAEGFGWADIEKRIPVTPTTRFRIGNASIMLTSAAAGLLIEDGRLKLDEPIQSYVPEYPKTKWPMTLRQVMAHTAGISTDGGDEGPLFGKHCDGPLDALPVFARADPNFEPGTQYRFSNFGWILVSAAIEKASGEGFLGFMQKRVFAPLRMDDTLAETTTEVEDRATSYFPAFASDPRYLNDVMRDLDLSCYAGGSAFLSSASDIARFALAINTGKLLKPETVQLLQTSQTLADGKETGYGLGWDIEDVTLAGKPTHSVGHDGELLGGIAVSIMTFRDNGIVVAALSNTSYSDVPALVLKIADAFATAK